MGLAFPLAEKDNVLITSGIINFFLDLYTLKLSQFFNAPQSEVKKFIPFDTLPGKLQIYSALSLHFRGDGNIEAAEKFLKFFSSLSSFFSKTRHLIHNFSSFSFFFFFTHLEDIRYYFQKKFMMIVKVKQQFTQLLVLQVLQLPCQQSI